MDAESDHLFKQLLRVHADLAYVRGAARSRRDAARVQNAPPGPWQTAHRYGGDLAPSIAAVQALTSAQLPPLAVADWDKVGELTPCREPVPLRIGTTRVGAGLGRYVDLPVVVPLLDAGNVLICADGDALAGRLAQYCGREIVAVVGNLVLRALLTAGIDHVRVISDRWLPAYLDVDELDGRLVYGVDPDVPGQLENLFAALRTETETVHRKHLGERFRSLAELAAATGERPVWWRIVIVSGIGPHLGERVIDDVQWLLQAGPAYGLHMILIDSAIPQDANVERVCIGPDRMRVSTIGPALNVTPDPVPDPGSAVMQAFVEQYRQAPIDADGLLPQLSWDHQSAEGLLLPIGSEAGQPFSLKLGDFPTHALVGGPAGSGKTNLIYGMIGALVSRYSPDEVELYLLDFKQAVSFTPAVPSVQDPSWLPHARLVGVNINNDREFGLALLQHLTEQLEIRARAVADHGTDNIVGLRAADPGGRWPRLVAVIDEFQVLLGERDAITQQAVALLEDVARRGRSFGIHLVLATQTVGSIEALWGRRGLVEQLVLRIALPRSTGVLADQNDAAARLADYHVIVNSASGVADHNRTVRLPNFGWDTFLRARKQQAWQQRAPDAPPPVLFDGEHVPDLAEAADYRGLAPGRAGAPIALLGRTMDVTDRAAAIRLDRAPDRNLTVLGNNAADACDVLASAALSLARQHDPADAWFSVLTGDGELESGAAHRLAEQLHRIGHKPAVLGRAELSSALIAIAADVNAALTSGRPVQRHYVLFLGVDAATRILEAPDPATGGSGHDALRRITRSGSETGVHLLAWWRTVQRMRDDLGGFAANLTETGTWVALDVQGAQLSPLPGGQLLQWSPRRRRALWFNPAAHRSPQLMTLYNTGLGVPEDS